MKSLEREGTQSCAVTSGVGSSTRGGSAKAKLETLASMMRRCLPPSLRTAKTEFTTAGSWVNDSILRRDILTMRRLYSVVLVLWFWGLCFDKRIHSGRIVTKGVF